MSQAFLESLKDRILSEKHHGLARLERQWAMPVRERVMRRRAAGPLRILDTERKEGRHFWYFDPSKDDLADFQEGTILRLSRDDPSGPGHFKVEFLGLTPRGLTVSLDQPPPPGDTGWTLDEDFVDLSGYYLAGLDELAGTSHGRDVVLPVLMGEDEREPQFDAEAADDAGTAAENEGAEASQVDAVAACAGAERYHLVQGPPGTGKTWTLALLAREFIRQEKRTLICAPTHRAIHHALRQISRLGVTCPVMKISDLIHHDQTGITFRESFAESGLAGHPGPYVLGITPVSLVTGRGKGADFDVAIIDEASQLRTEAAVLPMLRARRWFFFGDQQQLPPVVARPIADPKADSIFAMLAGRNAATMLRTTYRMNRPLTRWPSENFYHGELESASTAAGRRLRLEAGAGLPHLEPDPCLVRISVTHEGNSAYSDEEAGIAAQLIDSMLRGGLRPADIGVVVPFRAQAAVIRRLMRFDRFAKHPGIDELVVDTVERFQGQERKVMIASFTVSDVPFIELLADFLLYPQRLNVAVTRAEVKVILLHSEALLSWLERRAPYDETAALALSLFAAAAPLPIS